MDTTTQPDNLSVKVIKTVTLQIITFSCLFLPLIYISNFQHVYRYISRNYTPFSTQIISIGFSMFLHHEKRYSSLHFTTSNLFLLQLPTTMLFKFRQIRLQICKIQYLHQTYSELHHQWHFLYLRTIQINLH